MGGTMSGNAAAPQNHTVLPGLRAAMHHRYITLSALCWLFLLALSASWNIKQIQTARQELNLHVARSFFGLIVIMRDWNALHGGVYVPVSELIQPNPYLEVPDRDIQLPDGRLLTKVNPAYMTRLVAELAQQENQVRFHITSLQPVNPANGATAWEREALLAFEAKAQEFYSWNQQTASFSYMAPLVVQAQCLSCHEQHGYALGDIRGGISVTFQAPPVSLWPVGLTHSTIALVGLVAIMLVGRQLTRTFDALERQSQVDGLTGLYNRRYFDSYLQHEFARWKRTRLPLSVVIGDVDSFKAYNDLYGHQAGDNCLRTIAGILRGVVRRSEDIAARYGGEEFVLVLPNTPTKAASNLAEQARCAVEALAIRHAGAVAGQRITLSLGLATSNDSDQNPLALLERADRALYQAKQRGKNMVVAITTEPTTTDNSIALDQLSEHPPSPKYISAHRPRGAHLPHTSAGRPHHPRLRRRARRTR
jgi:diguanylate cyclase (GGDEF)-like protein